MIYLDNAATTYPKPEAVYRYVEKEQRNISFNSGRGSYAASKHVTAVIDNARACMAALVKAPNTDCIVFSPSATISMNQIILGLKYSEMSQIYITPFEHNAVVRPLYLMQEKHRFKITILPFNPITQELDVNKMKAMFISSKPDYVFMTHVSNVTGVIIPVNVISEIAANYNATVIVDAAQSIGLVPLDIRNIKVNYVVFAGHKNLYSHFGVGGFICNGHPSLQIAIAGGTGSDSLNYAMPLNLPDAYEPASHNSLAIGSLGESLRWLASIGVENIYREKKQLTDYLVQRLKEIPGIETYLPLPEIHIGVVSFNIRGFSAEDLGIILDEDYNIAVRTGYHCAPFVHGYIGTETRKGTVRLALGYFNTKEDIDTLICALKEIAEDRQ